MVPGARNILLGVRDLLLSLGHGAALGSSTCPMTSTTSISTEACELEGVLRFSDQAEIIPEGSSPRLPFIRFLTRSMSAERRTCSIKPAKGCLHNGRRRRSSHSTQDVHEVDLPVVHVHTLDSPPSSPVSPPRTSRSLSSGFLARFNPTPKEQPPSPDPPSPTLPLRPCCPECAHSFTEPPDRIHFTAAALRRQRAASFDDFASYSPPMAEKKCELGAVGMARFFTVPEEGKV